MFLIDCTRVSFVLCMTYFIDSKLLRMRCCSLVELYAQQDVWNRGLSPSHVLKCTSVLGYIRLLYCRFYETAKTETHTNGVGRMNGIA